ncbi:hypothetical protein ABZ614_41620, partial [Streptomyces sp. NPDC013178]
MPLFDTAPIRELGQQWKDSGNRLFEYLRTMHGSVLHMSEAWTGKAGQAALSVWTGAAGHNVWTMIYQSAYVMLAIGDAILQYAAELEKTMAEIEKAHLVEGLTTLFGMLFGVATFGAGGLIGVLLGSVGRITAAIGAVLSRLVGAMGAVGRAAAFTAEAIISGAFATAEDIAAQLAGSKAGGMPWVFDGEGAVISGVLGGVWGARFQHYFPGPTAKLDKFGGKTPIAPLNTNRNLPTPQPTPLKVSTGVNTPRNLPGIPNIANSGRFQAIGGDFRVTHTTVEPPTVTHTPAPTPNRSEAGSRTPVPNPAVPNPERTTGRTSVGQARPTPSVPTPTPVQNAGNRAATPPPAVHATDGRGPVTPVSRTPQAFLDAPPRTTQDGPGAPATPQPSTPQVNGPHPVRPGAVDPTAPQPHVPVRPGVVDPPVPQSHVPVRPGAVDPTAPQPHVPVRPGAVDPAAPQANIPVRPGAEPTAPPTTPHVNGPVRPGVVDPTAPQSTPPHVDGAHPVRPGAVDPTAPQANVPVRPGAVDPTVPQPTTPHPVGGTSRSSGTGGEGNHIAIPNPSDPRGPVDTPESHTPGGRTETPAAPTPVTSSVADGPSGAGVSGRETAIGNPGTRVDTEGPDGVVRQPSAVPGPEAAVLRPGHDTPRQTTPTPDNPVRVRGTADAFSPAAQQPDGRAVNDGARPQTRPTGDTDPETTVVPSRGQGEQHARVRLERTPEEFRGGADNPQLPLAVPERVVHTDAAAARATGAPSDPATRGQVPPAVRAPRQDNHTPAPASARTIVDLPLPDEAAARPAARNETPTRPELPEHPGRTATPADDGTAGTASPVTGDGRSAAGRDGHGPATTAEPVPAAERTATDGADGPAGRPLTETPAGRETGERVDLAGAPARGTEDPAAPPADPYRPAPTQHPAKAAEWEQFQASHTARYGHFLTALDRRADRLDSDFLWTRAEEYLRIHEPEIAENLSRGDHEMVLARRMAQQEWRHDVGMAFKAEADRFDQKGGPAPDFDAIMDAAETIAYKHLIRADWTTRYTNAFKEAADALREGTTGPGAHLPSFDKAPTRYLFDERLGRFVRDDSAERFPGVHRPDPEELSERARVDHFRDKTEDFNPLEQRYLKGLTEAREIFGEFFADGTTNTRPGPAQAARLQSLFDGIGREVTYVAEAEQRLHASTREPFESRMEYYLNGEEDLVTGVDNPAYILSDEAADRVRTGFRNDLRDTHEKIFGRGDEDGTTGHNNDRGKEALWREAVDKALNELLTRVQREEFVQNRLLTERRHADRFLDGLPEHVRVRLGADGRDRVVGEYLDAVRTRAEEFHTAWARGGDRRSPWDEGWLKESHQLRRTLPDRVRHDTDLQTVITKAVEDFHGVAGRPEGRLGLRLSEEVITDHAVGFRADRVTAYDALFGPEGRDTTTWLAHESRHEDAFHSTLGRLRTERLEPSGVLVEPARGGRDGSTSGPALPDHRPGAPEHISVGAMANRPTPGPRPDETSGSANNATAARDVPAGDHQTQVQAHAPQPDLGRSSAGQERVSGASRSVADEVLTRTGVPDDEVLTRTGVPDDQVLIRVNVPDNDFVRQVRAALPESFGELTARQVAEAYHGVGERHGHDVLAQQPETVQVEAVARYLQFRSTRVLFTPAAPVDMAAMAERVHALTSYTFTPDEIARAHETLRNEEVILEDLPASVQARAIARELQRTMEELEKAVREVSLQYYGYYGYSDESAPEPLRRATPSRATYKMPSVQQVQRTFSQVFPEFSTALPLKTQAILIAKELWEHHQSIARTDSAATVVGPLVIKARTPETHTDSHRFETVDDSDSAIHAEETADLERELSEAQSTWQETLSRFTEAERAVRDGVDNATAPRTTAADVELTAAWHELAAADARLQAALDGWQTIPDNSPSDLAALEVPPVVVDGATATLTPSGRDLAVAYALHRQDLAQSVFGTGRTASDATVVASTYAGPLSADRAIYDTLRTRLATSGLPSVAETALLVAAERQDRLAEAEDRALILDRLLGGEYAWIADYVDHEVGRDEAELYLDAVLRYLREELPLLTNVDLDGTSVGAVAALKNDTAPLRGYSALAWSHRPDGYPEHGTAVAHLRPGVRGRSLFRTASRTTLGTSDKLTGPGGFTTLLAHGPESFVRLAIAEANHFARDKELRAARDAGTLRERLTDHIAVEVLGGVIPKRDVERVVPHVDAVLARGVRVLDRDGLTGVVSDVFSTRAAAAGAGAAAALSVEECLELLVGLREGLFPRGVALPRVVDDAVVGTGVSADRLVAGARWRPVEGWDALRGALLAQGPGAAALVLVRRPRGLGHAFGAYVPAPARLGDRPVVVWLDLQQPDAEQRISEVPPSLAPVEARAVVIGADARVVEDALPEFVPSDSLGQASVDPATDHRYGYQGVEIEIPVPVLYKAPQGQTEYGMLVATHRASGARFELDSQGFYEVNGAYYASADEAAIYGTAEFREFPVLEFVSPPLPIYVGERARQDARTVLNLSAAAHQQLITGGGEIIGQGQRLGEVLLAKDGWTLNPEFMDVRLDPAVSGPRRDYAYTQLTVGVPVGGILRLLELVASQRQRGYLDQLVEPAKRFGRALAERFAEQHLGGAAAGSLDATGLGLHPLVREVWGYGWLVFNHVAALPFLNTVSSRRLVKNLLPVALRNPFGAVREALDPMVQEFLEDDSLEIAGLFHETLAHLLGSIPGADQRVADGVFNMTLVDNTVGDYLAYALEGQHVVSQREGVGMGGDYSTIGEHLGTPLVLLEIRQLGPDVGLMRREHLSHYFSSLAAEMRPYFLEDQTRLWWEALSEHPDVAALVDSSPQSLTRILQEAEQNNTALDSRSPETVDSVAWALRVGPTEEAWREALSRAGLGGLVDHRPDGPFVRALQQASSLDTALDPSDGRTVAFVAQKLRQVTQGALSPQVWRVGVDLRPGLRALLGVERQFSDKARAAFDGILESWGINVVPAEAEVAGASGAVVKAAGLGPVSSVRSVGAVTNTVLPPEVLDREGLARVVSQVLAGRDTAVPASVEECLELLVGLREELFPQGVASPGVVDDSVVGVGVGAGGLVVGGWRPVRDWDALGSALLGMGPGAAALVLVRRPRGVGHAFAA